LIGDFVPAEAPLIRTPPPRRDESAWRAGAESDEDRPTDQDVDRRLMALGLCLAAKRVDRRAPQSLPNPGPPAALAARPRRRKLRDIVVHTLLIEAPVPWKAVPASALARPEWGIILQHVTDVHELGIVPATLDRWTDVRELLGATAEDGCLCQPWRGFDTKALSGGKSRAELLRGQMASSTPPPPGYVAYLDGLAVGWVGVSVRTQTPRLMNSRTIPAVDDLPVWSIGCFQIRAGHRRRGIAKALLAAVVEAARLAGAPGVEAYPIDPGGRRVDVGAGFVGIASMFDRAGFRRVLVTDAHSGRLPRHLVRLDLVDARPRL
jgi:GNAT superfamily N-acetyltransferase